MVIDTCDHISIAASLEPSSGQDVGILVTSIAWVDLISFTLHNKPHRHLFSESRRTEFRSSDRTAEPSTLHPLLKKARRFRPPLLQQQRREQRGQGRHVGAVQGKTEAVTVSGSQHLSPDPGWGFGEDLPVICRETPIRRALPPRGTPWNMLPALLTSRI